MIGGSFDPFHAGFALVVIAASLPLFPDFTLPLFRDLKQVFKTATGQVFIFPSSGTGAWEAAMTNTLSPGDRVLAARTGCGAAT